MSDKQPQCPNCSRKTLVSREIKNHGVQVDCCKTCKGVWFDAAELNQILSVAVVDLQPPKSSRPSIRKCPKCEVRLRAFNYPQTYVEIDMCAECLGLWLEPNEFTEIKMVRKKHEHDGSLETQAPVEGVKGKVLDWVNGAIDSLMKFE